VVATAVPITAAVGPPINRVYNRALNPDGTPISLA
jgi:hypothetical protein